MKYDIIATGSKGNAVYLDGGVLIDCGVPFYKLSPVLHKIKLVLLTHEHGDHFNKSTVKRLASERPTVRFCCREWMVDPLLKAGVSKRCIDVIRENKGLCYGNGCFTVEPVTLFHDAPNCGWRVFFPDGKKLFYATDTGTLDGITVKNYDLYMIEANHTVEDIERRASEKIERGEYAYEVRAAANHLSKEQALDWILSNAGASSEFVLLHQHEGGDPERRAKE